MASDRKKSELSGVRVKRRQPRKRQPDEETGSFQVGKRRGLGTNWLRVPHLKQVAQLFSIHEKTAEEWWKFRGMPGDNKLGYDLRDVVAWYCAWKTEQAKEAAAKSEAPNLRNEKLQQEIRAKRLRNDRLEGLQLPADQVRAAHVELVHMLAARLDELPAAIAAVVPADVQNRVLTAAEHQVEVMRKELAAAPLV